MARLEINGIIFQDSPTISWRYIPETRQLLAYTAGSGGAGSIATGTPISANLSVASTNDYSTGGTFPTGIGRLYLNVDTVDATLTGMAAGVDGQMIIITNTGTFNLTLTKEDVLSVAANRFSGEGDGALPPGAQTFAIYNGTTSRWAIG